LCLWRSRNGTRFGNSETFGMNLSVAMGMNQDAILCGICAAHRFVDDVVVMPARHLRERLGTDRAEASLFLPEMHQSTSPLQGLCHFYAETCFKMGFPCWV